MEEVHSDEGAELLQQARSDNTRRAYAGDWARFCDWCAANGASPLPATTATVINYIAHLTTLGRAPATVERAVSAILSIHTDTGAERALLRCQPFMIGHCSSFHAAMAFSSRSAARREGACQLQPSRCSR
ncbi:site-specific integrase [Microbispora bryophytorum]|uniref:site-specific integrase n=1 Tax=Microbispora bryophytorum TaxID=1460882 RepID=UPI0033C28C49